MTTHRLERVSSADEAFVGLVRQLDADLAIRDGDENAFYAQFNGLEAIQHAVVLYLNEVPAACGAIKEYDATSAEVKRMFTAPEFRGNRLGAVVLSALEDWAEELGYERCILETGLRQPEAIRLYEREGFQRIPNYEPYKEMVNSVCFEKRLV